MQCREVAYDKGKLRMCRLPNHRSCAVIRRLWLLDEVELQGQCNVSANCKQREKRGEDLCRGDDLGVSVS